MKIVMRCARDDFYARAVAQAMESVGAEVFSIVLDRNTGKMDFWHVFARHKEEISTDAIDDAISEMYDSMNAGKSPRAKDNADA